MKLELKDLVPYLPYGLKIYMEDFRSHVKPFYWVLGKQTNLKEVLDFQNKPILRPLSDLNKHIEHNGENFTPIEWLDKNIKPPKHFVNNVSFTDNYVELSFYSEYQKLFEWHFDVFGLIEKGLAIDINTLEK